MFYAFIMSICGLVVFDWWRIRSGCLRNVHGIWSVLLLVFMLGLLMLPAWGRMVFGRGGIPRFLEQASWIWLAWVFWFGCAQAVLLVWNAMMYCVHRAGYAGMPQFSAFAALCISAGFVALMTIWGLVEANALRTVAVEIRSSRIPAEADGFKLALISDVHIGKAATEWRVEKTIALVNEAAPDIVLSAGDLIDGNGERERRLASLLQAISTRDGGKSKFAVFGNHDAYSGLAFSREGHEAAGFTLLEDEGVAVNDWLWLYGESDPACHPRNGEANHPAPYIQPPELPQPAELKAPNLFTILLKHRPDGFSSRFGKDAPFCLELSGHSHGGQIFPFNFLVRLQYPFTEGKLHTLPNGMLMYVTPGSGVWGPPFRVLARPEITIFTFRHL